MISYDVFPPGSQLLDEGRYAADLFGLPRERKDAMEGASATDEFYDDREILTNLLEQGLSGAGSRERSIDLDKEEEFTRLLPILWYFFSFEELTQVVGEAIAVEMLNVHRTQLLQNLFLEQAFQSVLRAFRLARLPLVVFKGPALAHTIYPVAHMRTYHDIDVLVHPEDVARAHTLLTTLGYVFYNEYRADEVDHQRTGYNYILRRPGFPFSVIVELHTAPHVSEIGSSFDRDAIWQRALSITILGEQTLTMHPIDHLLYICWHYRFHGFSRLIWLYDIVMMLRVYGGELDWHMLVDLARKQRIAVTLYYCLRWCHTLFGVAIPSAVFAQLRPPYFSRRLVERIAIPEVARTLAAPEDKDRRHVARRAMVDTNLGLLSAGLRTLFPSPTALRKRYLENSRLPMRLTYIFYPLHLRVTLAKGQRFLLRRRGRR